MRMSFNKVLIIGLLLMAKPLVSISSLAKNDPYPVYNAVYDPYLINWYKEYLKGCDELPRCGGNWALAISPFYQKAKRGRTFTKVDANLGDLTGPWNMLALTYGGVPDCCSPFIDADGKCTTLGKAKIAIFSDLFSGLGLPPDANEVISSTMNCEYILTDSVDEIGFFSLPIRYRKVGVRFQVDARLTANAGFTIQAGVSEIRQTLDDLIDLGIGRGPLCNTGFPCSLDVEPFPNNFFRNIPQLEMNGTDCCTSFTFTDCDITNPQISSCTTPYTQIEINLMAQEKARKIFRELGLDDCNFEETSFEDVRFIVWWRKLYEVNKQRQPDYPWLFVIPSLSFNAIAPGGKAWDRRQMLGLPFGNDRFWSVGFDAGLNLDFVETVQIAFSGGMNYFFDRTVDFYRLPTYYLQQGIFPCSRTVKVQPGYNFNLNALLSAYHFLDKLSLYAEWVMVKHEQDKIKLLPCPTASDPTATTDPIFTPEMIDKAECITKFSSHVVNASLYYDISPNMSLGFLFQFPLAQRNAYKSTTYLATFRAMF